jgi:hypothetical protein
VFTHLCIRDTPFCHHCLSPFCVSGASHHFIAQKKTSRLTLGPPIKAVTAAEAEFDAEGNPYPAWRIDRSLAEELSSALDEAITDQGKQQPYAAITGRACAWLSGSSRRGLPSCLARPNGTAAPSSTLPPPLVPNADPRFKAKAPADPATALPSTTRPYVLRLVPTTMAGRRGITVQLVSHRTF